MLDIPEFADKKECFKFLKENKKTLIKQKKFDNKHADAISFVKPSLEKGNAADKARATVEQLLDSEKITVDVVINTTKLLDSHSDVHINGIWSKSLQEQKDLMLLQEHRMTFKDIISSEVTAAARTMKWTTLGFDFEGTTQALIFTAEIDKNRNEYMHDQYAKGYVKQHSVGMQYVNILLAINSEEEQYKEEKATFDKYYNEIVNKEDVDSKGYFWAVTEAKIIEGSAVVRGSNPATPTQNIEPSKADTQKTEPSKNDTQKQFYNNLI
jgi:hypothetical protein